MPIEIENKVCRVRSNLFFFLLSTRKATEISEFYWIDALYIDQEDVEERNRTVARIKDIYGGARAVIIWLGGALKEAERWFKGLDLLTDISDFGLDKSPGWEEEAMPYYTQTTQELAKLKALYNHPYWHRGWILQEASTPHNSVVLMSLAEVWYGRERRFL
jgi:hypothetical protein